MQLSTCPRNKKTYADAQRGWLMNVQSFVQLVCEHQAS
jgi:hypothetical protein